MRNEIKRHYERVALLGCVLTGNPGVVLHHVFGGSIIPVFGMKSQSMRGLSDWLVIPIAPQYHTYSAHAFHSIGAVQWERRFGTQMEHLEYVNSQLDYDIFALAHKDIPNKIFRGKQRETI